MRVLVYLWMYPPYRYVGGELMTADLLEYLVRQGHEVDVYGEHIYETYERNGVKIQNSGYLNEWDYSKYDVAITHPEIRTGVWSRISKLPYVAVVHNTEPMTLRSIDRQPPTLTVANSIYTERHLPLSAHNSKMGVHVIHPPVLIEPEDGPRDHYTMINISLEKGGSVLNYAANRNPKLRFRGVMGGHGLQVDNQPMNVEIVKQTREMAGVYSGAKVLLFPSHGETYGKVVAEAMQFGIPVIASSIPAIREAAGDAAIYLDPYDYEGWSNAVAKMEDDTHRKEWAAASLERGLYLRNRSFDDLERWNTLVEEAAGK